MPESKSFIIVKPTDVSVYIPAGHNDTRNRRLMESNMGSKYVEVIFL